MAFKSLADIGGTCCAIGRAETEARLSDLVVLGFLAGVYVAFIPASIFAAHNVTWGQFFIANLPLVTLGNIVVGSFFVVGPYWFVYPHGKERSQ